MPSENRRDDSALWHELLDRASKAERFCDVMVEEILRSHDDQHSGPRRWCSSSLCRLAEDRRRRG
jgi:hypothetical protein